jgi:hypothetical protein
MAWRDIVKYFFVEFDKQVENQNGHTT